jgi:uncharacterized protein
MFPRIVLHNEVICAYISAHRRVAEDVMTMPEYIHVPESRLAADALQQLLEEFVTRDGTDYGLREHSTEDKVLALRGQMKAGDVVLVYEVESESWDLLPRDDAATLLSS